MREKFAAVAAFVLLLPLAVSATSVYTEYEGEGGLTIVTTLDSTYMPDLTSTANVGSGSCCNCVDCEPCECPGSGYSGYQFVSNNPYAWSSDYAEAEDGCIELHQQVVDYIAEEDQTITTNYYAGISGTGNATLMVAAMPRHTYGYQSAQGTGRTWVYFDQLSELADEFDFQAIFGAGTIDCNYGYVVLEGETAVINSPVLYRPMVVEIICLDPGRSYATLYGRSTDTMNASVHTSMGNTDWFMSAGTGDGEGTLLVDTEYEGGFTFDFEMVLE